MKCPTMIIKNDFAITPNKVTRSELIILEILKMEKNIHVLMHIMETNKLVHSRVVLIN